LERVAQLEAELNKQAAELTRQAGELKLERLKRQEAEWKLQKLLGKYFGKSSEAMDPAQLQLLLEGVEAVAAESSAQQTAPAGDAGGPRKSTRSKRMGFPEEMREEVLEIDVPEEERICPDTGKERKLIRWEETTKINFVPSQFVRVRIRRAVRAVSGGYEDALSSQPVVSAPMPAAYRVIPNCIAGSGLLVYLMVAKYCDHLPFYRLQQIFKRRHGVDLDRHTMCQWMKRCAMILGMLYEILRKELVSGKYLQIDETFIKLLDPEVKGKARQSHFWVIKRPGVGVLFRFDPSRGHQVAEALLEGFASKLQCDGYGAYDALERKVGSLLLFRCWAHTRRKFHEALEANGAAAAWYVAEIARLYRVEAQARAEGLDAVQRGELRAAQSKPVLAGIKERLDRDLSRGDILPSSPLGKAVRYALGQWPGLLRYAEPEHGEVEIDTNEAENAIRPTAVGKKNWLFIGHPKAGQVSAIIYTIIENCRMHGIDPMEYLLDVLPRIESHPEERRAELLPAAWKKAQAAPVAA
jgi:transposase